MTITNASESLTPVLKVSSPKRIVKRIREWENLPSTFSKTWTLWIDQTAYEAGKSAKQFYEGIINLGDFSSLDEFCDLWSEITDEQGWPKLGRSTSIFQKGIAPAWEHKDNALGGHWLVKINNFEKSEQVWYSLLMTILCEQLTGVRTSEINGIMISPRERGTMIYVWNRHSLNGKYKEIMQNFIRDTLDVPQHWMRYNTHKYKLNKNKTKKKEQQEQAHAPSSTCDDQENTNSANTTANPSQEPQPQPQLQPTKNDHGHPSTDIPPRSPQRPSAQIVSSPQSQPSVADPSQDPNLDSFGESKRSIEIGKEEQSHSEEEEHSEGELQEYDHISDDDEFLEEGQQPMGTSMEYIADPPLTAEQSFLAKHWFTISIGFLIFIAALYNIYIIFNKL